VKILQDQRTIAPRSNQPVRKPDNTETIMQACKQGCAMLFPNSPIDNFTCVRACTK